MTCKILIRMLYFGVALLLCNTEMGSRRRLFARFLSGKYFIPRASHVLGNEERSACSADSALPPELFFLILN